MNDENKKIGKIVSATIGFGGYQNACFGLLLTFESKKGHWGVGSFTGAWAPSRIEWSEHCKWTEEDRDRQLLEMVRLVDKTLAAAGVETVDKLVGIPVEITFKDFNTLESWRILEEAI